MRAVTTLDRYRPEYRLTLRTLTLARVPFVVGGSWAVEQYVSLGRRTIDLDLMVPPDDIERSVEALTAVGGQVLNRDEVQVRLTLSAAEVDLVHHFASGERAVGRAWRQCAVPGRLFGVPVLLASPVDLILSKLFVVARHRFDGADVVHLLRATAKTLDWSRLRSELAPYPGLLPAFLALHAFCYPSERSCVPDWLWEELIGELRTPAVPGGSTVCRGTLLDRQSFEFDLLKGCQDVRPFDG